MREKGQEQKLIDYIKYLIGQQKNETFQFKKEDFAQRHELNVKNILLPSFDEYALQEEDAMKTVANDIIQRVDYNLVVHHFSDPISIMKQATDPKYAYFRICHLDMELAIPLLARVVNKQLCLSNYLLSIGHVKALVKTFEYSSEFLNKFLLDNCGLTDNHNEVLFSAFMRLDQVKDLVLRRTDIGKRSLDALIPSLYREYPNHLSCLRLINCKIGAKITHNLITALRQKNQLQTLALVNANIQDAAMLELGQLVKESKYLVDFDISWNLVKTTSYITLINALQDNRALKNLNLSWNKLVDHDTKNIRKSQQQLELPAKDSARSISIESSGAPWYDRDPEYTEMEKQLIECLLSLIKRNRQLLHVNLT
jgi:hypothetical protein